VELEPVDEDVEEEDHEEEAGQYQDECPEERRECNKDPGTAPERSGCHGIGRAGESDRARDEGEEQDAIDDEEADLVLERVVQALILHPPECSVGWNRIPFTVVANGPVMRERMMDPA